MKNKFLYTCIIKETGAVIQDIAYSREEAREMKNLYEGMYKSKVNILRYELDRKVR
jgi:hypothetical protein